MERVSAKKPNPHRSTDALRQSLEPFGTSYQHYGPTYIGTPFAKFDFPQDRVSLALYDDGRMTIDVLATEECGQLLIAIGNALARSSHGSDADATEGEQECRI